MSQDWGLFTSDLDENPPTIQNLLPSSLKDVWDDNDQYGPSNTQEPIGRSPSPQQKVNFSESGSFSHRSRPFPFAESAPALSFMDDAEGAIPTLQPSIISDEQEENLSTAQYYFVQFHPFRVEAHQWSHSQSIPIGSYVVTVADRGFDIGKVVEEIQSPSQKVTRNSKVIVRVASRHEISQLPIKEEREAKALEFCRSKASDFQLPMQITGAEIQFDGKKLTFYYTANSYIDFRALVRVLFKTFGMRIWMVWHDGHGPLRDVLHRSGHQSPQ